MIRENLRSQPFQDIPRVVEKYQASDLNFEDKVSELLAHFYNVMNTIYPTKLEVSLIDSNAKPKKFISDVIAKTLMRTFITPLAELYYQVFNEPLPERVPLEYMKKATRNVSTPIDRRFENLPVIARLNEALRVKRVNRIKRVERLIRESGNNNLYNELVTHFGERLANEARSWLVSQYEGHTARLPRRASRVLLGNLFLFLGEGEIKDNSPVEITGRLLHSNFSRQVLLTSRLTENFNIHLVRGVEELQPEVRHAMRILLFTSFFYGLLPEILLRIQEIYWGEGEENSQIIIDETRNMSLEPKLYFVYDTYNPLQFNSMIKTTRFAKMKPLFDKFTEVIRSEDEPERKVERIFLGFIRSLRIVEKELASEMVNMMNEWEQWESYTTYDEEGVEGLPIKNMSINLKVPKMEDWIETRITAEPELVQTLETFQKFEPEHLDELNKLNWRFYAKNTELAEYQFTELLPECIDQVNEKLLELGYPQITFGIDYLEDLRDYCRRNSFTLKIVGNGEVYYGSEYVLVATPSHLSIEEAKKQATVSKNVIAQYRDHKTFTKKKVLVPRERNPVSLEEWELGMELPYDPEIMPGCEKELRNHFLCIDIESLSVEGVRQDPYLICAVGYLGDNSPITYRAWSNKYIQRYYKGEEETINVINGDWSTEYCMILFVEWLALIVHHYSKEKPLYIWGFNSMSYELTYLLLPLSKKFGNIEMLGHPNDCRSFKIGEGRIIFADILKILAPKSLKDYCKEFNLIIKKEEFEINHIKTTEQVEESFEEIKKYCYLDCISTLLLIHKVQAGLLELAQKLKIPHETESITRRLTASSFGWFFYIQGFVQQSISNSKIKNGIQNNEPEELYKYQRYSYTGGVVQVYRYVYEKRIYKVDVNSMYPAMCLKPMPWFYEGEIEEKFLVESLSWYESDLFLYEVISFELPATFIGAFIATKQEEGKNTYWNSYYGPKPIYVRGVVAKRIIYHKGTINFKRGWMYSSRDNTTLKNFSEVFYKERLQARNSSIKELCKLMMNSVTGRCAMAEQREYNAKLLPSSDLYIVYDQDLYLEYSQPILPPSGRLVRITSMITDYAKVYLDELHEKAGYGNVLYSDTDSLIVTEPGYINLGKPGRTSSILGEFKVETEKDMKEIYYEVGYFKNRKDYILKYKDNEGKTQYLHKSKGIPKKYITREYTEHIIRCFKLLQPDLVKQPFGEVFNVGEKIKMSVWRGEPFYGTTIKAMLKKSSVIVDRYFEEEDSVGIPRSDKYFEV